jgi:hypothetical protein
MRRDEIAGMRLRILRRGAAFLNFLVPKDETKVPVSLPELNFDGGYDAWVGNLPFLGSDILISRKEIIENTGPVEWRDHQWMPANTPPPKPEKDLVTPAALLVAFGLPALIVALIYFATSLVPLVFLNIAAAIVLYAAYVLGYIFKHRPSRSDAR